MTLGVNRDNEKEFYTRTGGLFIFKGESSSSSSTLRLDFPSSIL